MLLGTVTDTQDTTGTVLSQRSATVTREALKTTLNDFLGEQQQLPPMYSAVKINGKKLYEIARIKAEAIRLKLEEEARNKANKLKKSSLKDRLAIQVEMAEEAISKGSESKKKLESKRKNPSPQKRG